MTLILRKKFRTLNIENKRPLILTVLLTITERKNIGFDGTGEEVS